MKPTQETERRRRQGMGEAEDYAAYDAEYDKKIRTLMIWGWIFTVAGLAWVVVVLFIVVSWFL